jgi:hypothetical protein
MRKPIATLVLLIVLCATPTAAASAAQTCNPSATGGEIDCGGERDSVTLTSVNGSSGNSSSNLSGPRYVPYDRLVMQADGQGCVTTGYTAEGVQPSDAVPADPSRQNLAGAHDNVFVEYPPCPPGVQAAVPAGVAPAETRAMVAARYWEQVPLPRPRPVIAPGRAITGKLAFLETNGEVSHRYTNATVFGPLEIVATGSYTVAWGDGQTTGPYRLEGRSWPSGQITHDYLSIGVVDILVTESWTAAWHLDGQSGVLRTLQTTGRIDRFPVEQIQAVIGR